MVVLKQTKVTAPDFVEALLIIILAIWVLIVLWLIERAITFDIQSIITWQSLTTFFAAFVSIIVLVIAVLVADIRKEIKELY